MLSRDLRKRLDELSRAQRARDGVFRRPKAQEEGPVSIDDAAPGKTMRNSAGKFLLRERLVCELISNSDDLHSSYSFVFDRGGFAPDPASLHADLQAFLELDPGQILYLDIETTGLGAGPVFLIGLMTYENRSLILRQLLARDYSEEPAMLAHLAELYPRYAGLVTFNGKSFDVRYIQERFIANGIRCHQGFHHLDLLHEGRRRWKDLLPNCKLQTLERHVTGRNRFGDIPGSEIPDVYHEFVKTGDARKIRDVLHHNALDLITMAEVLVHILSGQKVEKVEE